MGTCKTNISRFNSKVSKSQINIHIKARKHNSINDQDKQNNTCQKSFKICLSEGEKLQLKVQKNEFSNLNRNSYAQKHFQSPSEFVYCQVQKVNSSYHFNFLVQNQKYDFWYLLRQERQWTTKNIIKVGHYYFSLIKLHVNQNSVKNTVNQSVKKQKGQTCRICLSEQYSQMDPLVSFCQCTGSLKYAHKMCISSWIFEKKGEEYKKLIFRPKCQLCQSTWKDSLQIKQILADYVSFCLNYRPQPYAILEVTTDPTSDNKQFYIIDFNKLDTCTIGRSDQANLSFFSNSISKIHCQVSYKNKKLYINDQQSKNGTFVNIDDKVIVNNQTKAKRVIHDNMIITIKSIL